MVAIGLEHLIGFEWAPRSGAVEGHGIFVPTMANGIDDSPCLEHLVVPGKEGGVSKNSIPEESFVRFGGVGTELAGVTELHIDGLNGAASGAFGIEAEVNTLVGLEANMHGVTPEKVSEFGPKESGGWTTKDDDNFGGASGEGFSGAKIEGDTRPAPVIDLNFESGVGFGGGVRVDAVALAVALVLGANRAGGNGLEFGRGDGAKNFYFFIVNRLRGEVGGRFHGGDREKLHHMVLHHVPHRADFVIESAPRSDPFLLGHGDLHVVDQVAVPDGFPDGVGEAEIEKILDGFFAEVVIDAEEVGLVQAGLQIANKFLGGSEVVPERFFDDDAGGEAGTNEAGLGELLDDGGKVVGSGRQIKDVLGEATVFGQFIQGFFQFEVGFGVVEIPSMVGEFGGEVFPLLGRNGAKAGKFVEAFFHFLAELFVGFGATSEADDGVVGRESSLVLQAKKGRDEFAGGEVSAGPKDDHDERGKDPIGFWGRARRVFVNRDKGWGGGGAHGWVQ